jgi:hypothetical protein
MGAFGSVAQNERHIHWTGTGFWAKQMQLLKNSYEIKHNNKTTKNRIFCVATPNNSVDIHRRFGRMHRLRFQDRRVRQSTRRQAAHFSILQIEAKYSSETSVDYTELRGGKARKLVCLPFRCVMICTFRQTSLGRPTRGEYKWLGKHAWGSWE